MDIPISSADRALYAWLLTVQLVSLIQQMYIDEKIVDLMTYNRLYEAARKVESQIQCLVALSEENEGERD